MSISRYVEYWSVQICVVFAVYSQGCTDFSWVQIGFVKRVSHFVTKAVGFMFWNLAQQQDGAIATYRMTNQMARCYDTAPGSPDQF